MKTMAMAVMFAAGAAAGQTAPPNDDCGSPLGVTGQVFLHTDLTNATPSPRPFDCDVPSGPLVDVWFCLEAPVTGTIFLTTALQSTVGDTILAVYRGCGCDAVELCCNDDRGIPGDGYSAVSCAVVCGERYMVRVGAKPGTPYGVVDTVVEWAGDPCPRPVSCGSCCGAAPRFTGFPGTVAVQTHSADSFLNPPHLRGVVEVFDLSGQAAAPVGANWIAPAWGDAHATNWSRADLGTVFGVTLDDLGNIYVAHSSVYASCLAGAPPNPDALGALAPTLADAAGAIYRIDSNTGVASWFCRLPNMKSPGCNSATSDCYPGLGNLCFDCASGVFYASDHEDGRIYRIDRAGNPLNAYKHATGRVFPDATPDAELDGRFIPLASHPITGRGQRVWAVQTNGGRLFYSVWREHYDSHFCGAGVVTPEANEVWSIALDPAGDFIPGSERLELSMAGFPYFNFGNVQASNPISDISFRPGAAAGPCAMLLAERTMAADSTSGAHASRILEFAWDAPSQSWIPSGRPFRNGSGPEPDSSAGGCDYDHDLSAAKIVNVWTTQDAIRYPNPKIYGLAAYPLAGAPGVNTMIDYDAYTAIHDKTEEGDVEVSCPQDCAAVTEESVACEIVDGHPTGAFIYCFTITNLTRDRVAEYLNLFIPGVQPNPVRLPSLAPGESARTCVRITGRTPGAELCFDAALMDIRRDACCSFRHCITLPDCRCAQFPEPPAMSCDPAGGISLPIAFTPMDFDVAFVFLTYEPDPNGPVYDVRVLPDFQPLAVPRYQTGRQKYTIQTNAPAGTRLCFRFFMHTENIWECCSEVFCLEVPRCEGAWPCPGDFNKDGFIDFFDYLEWVRCFETGDCPPDRSGDFNNDGFIDFFDYADFVATFESGC